MLDGDDIGQMAMDTSERFVVMQGGELMAGQWCKQVSAL